MQQYPPDMGVPTATAQDCSGVLNALTAERRHEIHEEGIARGIAVRERHTILGHDQSVVRFENPADCWRLFTPEDLDAGQRLGDAYRDWMRLLSNDPEVIAHKQECEAARERGESMRYDVTAAADRHKREAFERHGVAHTLAPAKIKSPPARRGPRARLSHGPAPARQRGSRRSSSSSGDDSAGSDSDAESSSPPPRLSLWRHPRYGAITPDLLRILLAAAS